MFQVGRICYKIAGRDSNNVCVVVDTIDEKYVLVDGNTRRKKVNVAHIEPTSKKVELQKGADTATVRDALEKAGYTLVKKGEPKKTPARAIKQRATKKQVESKPVKKAAAKPKAAKPVAEKKPEPAKKEASKPKVEAEKPKSEESKK